MNEDDLQYFERLAAEYEEMGSSATASDFLALVSEVRRLQGQVEKYSRRARKSMTAAKHLMDVLGQHD